MPFLSDLSIGNDYQSYGIQNQMELLFSIKTGSFPLYSPGYALGHSSIALTWSQIFHPISYLGSIMPGYWEGKALHWHTFFKMLSLGITQLVLFIFLRRLKLNMVFSFLLSFITVYNLRMLDMIRFGPALEAYTAHLILCASIGWYFINPSKILGPLGIIFATYMVVVSGHPQMMYYGLLGSGLFLLAIPFFISELLPDKKIDSNNSENMEKIKILSLEKESIYEKMKQLDSKISFAEEQMQKLNILKIKLQGIEEKQFQLKEVERSNNLLRKDIDILNKQIEILKNSVFELRKFDNIFEEKQKEFEEALKEERIVEIKVAELKREIEVFSKQIEELKEKVKETEDIKKKLDYITELENWLSKKFVPVVSLVEKNVMVNLKIEFSKLFEEWFYMLVSDSFNVRLGDDFTPIIEQQDYEIDYAYLSGGERTAIALAYRLALNQVINSVLSKIKTKDFVILDEPTDGFSNQQLDKIRDVLQELNVNQLIIVSHEQKIESFVENVIRIRKENGVSFVERV